ncbi:MAG: thioesterase family protein [Bacteroidota bacterium]
MTAPVPAYRNVIQFPVRFGDLDAMGHVNNVRFLAYFEEGRVAWFREVLGMAPESYAYPVVVARVEIDFLASIGFGREVRVGTRCARIGGKSLLIEGEIQVDSTPPQVASRYKCTLVYVDAQSGQSISVPEADRKRITTYEPGLS